MYLQPGYIHDMWTMQTISYTYISRVGRKIHVGGRESRYKQMLTQIHMLYNVRCVACECVWLHCNYTCTCNTIFLCDTHHRRARSQCRTRKGGTVRASDTGRRSSDRGTVPSTRSRWGCGVPPGSSGRTGGPPKACRARPVVGAGRRRCLTAPVLLEAVGRAPPPMKDLQEGSDERVES